jgi:hypothetical protein
VESYTVVAAGLDQVTAMKINGAPDGELVADDDVRAALERTQAATCQAAAEE